MNLTSFMRRCSAAFAVSACALGASAATDFEISFADGADAFPLVGAEIYAPAERAVISTVADMFAGDVEAVSGVRPAIVKKAGKKPLVVIGTASNAKVKALAAKAGVDLSGLDGGFETYIIKSVDNPFKGCPKALFVVGSDPRGAAYGALSVSEEMGVSPWSWWADVPVEKHDSLFVKADYLSKEPSIRYRGIFINDEDWGLTPWSAKNFEPEVGNIGPRTYAKVCELLLRLKANMLAPAMHTCSDAFYTHADNKVVADKYGIMITTSHCEPLLFNNASKAEWDGAKDGDWNYKTNRETIYNKLDARVAEAGKYDNIYTMAMRGLHDEGMRGNMSTEEKVEVLHNAIMDQRGILAKHIDKPVETIPQIFVPYKEAQTLYEAGLEVPDDITLVWPDDNYGYIKMLSNPRDRKRSGRAGVYYHVSYLGVPHDYLWISTTAPMLMYEELKKAYDTGADRYWLLNVGDIKPMELSMQLFFSMAWDFGKFSYNNVNNYQTDFMCSVFGEKYRADFKRLLDEYYRLAWSRKPEAMGWERIWDAPEYYSLDGTDFSFKYYNDAQTRLAQYTALATLADDLYKALPADLQPAFFEMIGYQAMASNQMNRKFLLAQLSNELAAEGRPAEANWAAAQAVAASDSIDALNHRYNTMLDGKWNHMMTIPPGICSLYQNMPDMTVTPGAGEKPVDLAPVAEDYRLEDCMFVPVGSFSKVVAGADHDVRLLDGIGFDWQALQLGEITQPTVDASRTDCPLRVEYELPAIEADSVKVIVYTVPRFPLYKGANAAFGISVDGAKPFVSNLIPKEQSKPWKDDVIRNSTITEASFAIDKNAGKHRLAIICGDPGLIVQRILVDWGGLKPTYIGPGRY